MGGKALKGITRRFQKEEFFELSKELLPKVSQSFNTEVHLVQSYYDKVDFGDMDILILNNGNLGLIADKLNEVFKPKQIKSNGNCYSFDYKDLQIDLILITPINWETAKCFYSWGDLGNLMGKISHQLGLKYGWDGLKYTHYVDGRKLGTLYVSRNIPKIFCFLGLEYKTFLRGFNNPEEMFKYVMTSKYFNPRIFSMDNLRHRDKQRNKKRQGYKDFLKYLHDNDIYSKYTENLVIPNWKDEINKWFPEASIDTVCLAFEQQDALQKSIASKFNGRIVMERYPELTGKLLGDAISNFKKSKEDWSWYVEKTSPEQILIDFEANLTGMKSI